MVNPFNPGNLSIQILDPTPFEQVSNIIWEGGVSISTHVSRSNIHDIGVGGDGNSLLHIAAGCNNAVATDFLLSCGACHDATNDYGETPLAVAQASGSGEVARKLERAAERASAPALIR